jgi:beta-glucosidase
MSNNFCWKAIIILLLVRVLYSCVPSGTDTDNSESKIDSLLSIMTLEEKIGQLYQASGSGPEVEKMIREKGIGSIINEVDPKRLNEIQRIAIEESRLGIPVIIGRDVIHGFKTIFPIPLGQAATWNPDIVRRGAQVAAAEARSVGVHWTFAPMLDISRDARWGRIAESLGEDTYLTQILGVAMVEGFQGNDLSRNNTIAACAKHFAAYGAAEGGRDYNTVDLSMETLHNVYLPPFKSVADAGAATFMVSFNEINGVPSSGNEYLVNQVLKDDWNFDGFVVSDWASIFEMINHGFAADLKHAAQLAINAGVDMEMVTTAYPFHMKELIDEGKVSMSTLDDAVKRILRIKFQLGLFENPYVDENIDFDELNPEHLAIAKEAAVQSLVLLKNSANVLPLDPSIGKVAIIGPMADDGYEQLGTWVFDGEERHSVTTYKAISGLLGKEKILFEKGLAFSRDMDNSKFQKAINSARSSDAVVVVVGEESILSGEAHCRADITLPGRQAELIRKLSQTDKPVIAVIIAGRPLALSNIEPYCDAIIYAWHPGTMGGPAIADVLFGIKNPSGKLPASFPNMSGQEPLYYNHKNTGRPATDESFIAIEDIPVRAAQTSLGNTSQYLDAGYKAKYPFGFGLSYTTFSYDALKLSMDTLSKNDTLKASVHVKNTGSRNGVEIVQLYIRDLVGSITRPVKELKAFSRIELNSGEEREVTFTLTQKDLAFYGKENVWTAEPGDFEVFIGGNSVDCVAGRFRFD